MNIVVWEGDFICTHTDLVLNVELAHKHIDECISVNEGFHLYIIFILIISSYQKSLGSEIGSFSKDVKFI